MYCENCGSEIPSDATFCPNCGVNVKPTNSSKQKVNSITDDLKRQSSNFFEDWKSWSGKKKLLSIILCCCIGWIVIGGIIGGLTPDQNTSDNYQSDHNSNVNLNDTSNDVKNTTTDSVSASHISSNNDDSSSGSYSDTSSSSSSSSSSSHSDTSSSSGGSYVGNANTKKFHTSSCSHAGRIKSSNKVYFSSRDDAISSGYVPCKVCNP